ncbi:hypothetical protein [Rhodococcoides yunnanense]|uniref:hypothetical protein n=1 Tax=Rhodococcoides yunnanense TaxID=278209 RepID=UPI0009343932|nr:hypothetical protein [Rhodococcus yunnanensis]
MKRLSKAASTIVAAIIAILVGFSAGSVAHANPPVDPVAALTSVGVPAEVAALAAHAVPVVGGVDTVNLANPRGGFPGSQVDAIIDHPARNVTVVQRWLEYEPSRLQVGWVNLGTGRAGITDLPGSAPGTIDGLYPTIDRTGVLPTGTGPVVVVVYGQIPGWSGLIPLAPEYFGYLTPAVALLQV